MQTTLRINDDTFRRAKAKSGELGVSLTFFFEEAVEERLARLEELPPQRIQLPVSSVSGRSLTQHVLSRRIEAANQEFDSRKVQCGGSTR